MKIEHLRRGYRIFTRGNFSVQDSETRTLERYHDHDGRNTKIQTFGKGEPYECARSPSLLMVVKRIKRSN